MDRHAMNSRSISVSKLSYIFTPSRYTPIRLGTKANHFLAYQRPKWHKALKSLRTQGLHRPNCRPSIRVRCCGSSDFSKLTVGLLDVIRHASTETQCASNRRTATLVITPPPT